MLKQAIAFCSLALIASTASAEITPVKGSGTLLGVGYNHYSDFNGLDFEYRGLDNLAFGGLGLYSNARMFMFQDRNDNDGTIGDFIDMTVGLGPAYALNPNTIVYAGLHFDMFAVDEEINGEDFSYGLGVRAGGVMALDYGLSLDVALRSVNVSSEFNVKYTGFSALLQYELNPSFHLYAGYDRLDGENGMRAGIRLPL